MKKALEAYYAVICHTFFGGLLVARKIFSFRLEEALVGRIDALGVKRADFVRDALEAALNGGVNNSSPGVDREVIERVAKESNEILSDVPMKPAKYSSKPRKPMPKGADHPDAQAVFAILLDRPRSEKQLASDLGWMLLRVERAVKRLGSSVRYEAGVVHPA